MRVSLIHSIANVKNLLFLILKYNAIMEINSLHYLLVITQVKMQDLL